MLSRDPWVVILDNFLSDTEAKALISNVDQWEQSTDTGDTNEFGEINNLDLPNTDLTPLPYATLLR